MSLLRFKSRTAKVEVTINGASVELRFGALSIRAELKVADLEHLRAKLQSWLRPWLDLNAPKASVTVFLSQPWIVMLPIPSPEIAQNAQEFRDFSVAYASKSLDVAPAQIEAAWVSVSARHFAYVARREVLETLRTSLQANLQSIQPTVVMQDAGSKPLYIDFQQPDSTQASKFSLIFLLVSAGLLYGCLFEYAAEYKKLQAIQIDSAQMAVQSQGSPVRLNAETGASKVESRIRALVGFSWKSIFDALEASNLPTTRIVEMSHDVNTGQFKIALEATSTDSIFEFLRRLEDFSPASKPRLISHQAMAPNEKSRADIKASIVLNVSIEGQK